ncbi:hypothetical protein [Tunturiibacter psychrotolerans]|uniref:hypothetical protein n=1 Tax=Tunturiibacter psychrotolerans TaxID=3069686 RepID=UPI003D1AAD07
MPSSPHVLLAAPNVRKMQANLTHLLSPASNAAIEAALTQSVIQLYRLGRNHYLFARRQNNRDWRQKISRYYYGAYNVSRSVRLCNNGDYSADSTDHKKIETLPSGFPNIASYQNQLSALREDRNLCDYDHTSSIGILALGLLTTQVLVADFIADARTFLVAKGITP